MFIEVQTLLNNKDYRKRVVMMANDSKESPLSKKEIYCLHIEYLSKEELSDFSEAYRDLWVTLKDKFLVLIEVKKSSKFLLQISEKLRNLAIELTN